MEYDEFTEIKHFGNVEELEVAEILDRNKLRDFFICD